MLSHFTADIVKPYRDDFDLDTFLRENNIGSVDLMECEIQNIIKERYHQDIWVKRELIVNIFNGLRSNYDASGSITSDKLFKKLYYRTIEKVVQETINYFNTIKKNNKISVWNQIIGDGNAVGLTSINNADLVVNENVLTFDTSNRY